MPRLLFQPLGDSWALVFILLVALVVGLLTLSPKESGLSPTTRRVEFGLRLALVAIFAILFSRPSLVRTEREELPASVLFLCDVSESMSIRDEEGGVSRYDAMRASFESARDSFRALCEKFDARVVGFGDGIEEIEVEDGVPRFPENPLARETRLGDALDDSLRSTAGKRLLGVVVASDGTQRARDPDAATPQDVALRLRDAERPVFAVPFGSKDASATILDVDVSDLRANDRVFLGNELKVAGQVRLLGCAGRQIPLTLSLETSPGVMEVVDQTTLTPKSNDATLSYQFACAPQSAGEWKLCVSSPIQDGELVATNNELGTFVEAVDGGLDVLYIEGARRYEQNFLRAALESSSDVRVHYWRPSTAALVAKSPGATETEMIAASTKSRKSLVDLFTPGKYAAYVLGDVDSTAFQPNELKALAESIEQGAGLVVLAGERSLSFGGYAESPLADAFPVQTFQSDRLPLDSDLATFDANASESQRARFHGEFRATPVQSEGRDDFIVRLSGDRKKNRELWNALPPLSEVYRVGKVKPNATTVLSAESTTDKKTTLPLLITQQYGAGRVAVMATDSTWRWRMRGAEEAHEKFWRQLFLWVAKFDELLEGELAVELDQTRFEPDEKIPFRIAYRPKQGENVENMRVQATIVAPDGTRESVDLTEEKGVWSGVGYKTSGVGDYSVEATAIAASGAPIQTARARFLVRERNLELERPIASPDTLENLAATTEGKVVKPNELKELIDDFLKRRETIVDEREVKRSLYDSWAVFLAFVALATADWIWRKRRGMV